MPSRYPNVIYPPPSGMNSASDRGELPIDRARLVRGFTPARNGRAQQSTPLQRILQTDDGTTVTGISYYGNPQIPTQDEFNAGHYRKDRLIVVKNGVQLYISPVTFDINTLDMTFGDLVYVGDLIDVRTGGLAENQNIRTVQYKDELFIVAGDGSIPMRFFMNEFDAAFLYRIGIATPTIPVTAVAGPAGLVNGAVTYYHTDADEKGRESSPSTGTSITVVNLKVELSNIAWGADTQIVNKYIYRTQNGAPGIAYRIATLTDRSVTTYEDNNLDANISSNTQMPQFGANDPPHRASSIEIHKVRLFMNDRNIYDDVTDVGSLVRLQQSNLDNPTQFNQVADPLDLTLGEQLPVGNRNSDELVGIISDGSILAIGTRMGWYHLYGDDLVSFVIRYQHNVGLTSVDSLVSGDGVIFYQSETGPKMTMFAEGFVPRDIALEIRDQFSGIISAVR